MTSRKILSSITGLLSPLPVLLAFKMIEGISAPPIGSKSALFAVFLLSLGIALWPSIDPLIYSITLAFSYCIWVTIVTIAISGTTGNLFGLGVIMALVGGVTVAIPAGSLAWLMRRWSLPPWVPAVPIVAACLITAYDRVAAQQEVGAMPGNLEEIRRAERAYAGGRTDHTYTCNGPDLPGLTGIKWRTADNSDGSHHSEGEYKGFWIVLSCAPSEHPTYFSVHARGLWKNAPSFEINSDSTKPTIRQE